MDGYIDTRTIAVKRLQADRRADAAAHRLAADRYRDRGAQGRAERLLVVVFLVVLVTVGLAGAGFRLEPGMQADQGAAPAAGHPGGPRARAATEEPVSARSELRSGLFVTAEVVRGVRPQHRQQQSRTMGGYQPDVVGWSVRATAPMDVGGRS